MAAAASTQFVIPSDYTFTPGGLLVHKDTYARAEKLMNQAQNRDPDMHDMYIYNDFFGYAVLELVDDTLSAIHSFVAKKKWLNAWNALFALTVFNSMCGGVWTQVDDGDRVIATEKTFAALAVAIIRALESAEPSALNEETITNLESALMDMAAWGEAMAGSYGAKYTKVVRGYGKKLFGTRTVEDRKALSDAEKKAYEDFVKALSDEERKKRGDRLPGKDADEDDEDEDEGEDDKTPWFGQAKAKDAELNDAAFKLTPVWKAYKDVLARSPHHPMRGPKTWDLTKWSAVDKKQFSYDGMGDGSDDDEFMF